MTRESAAEQCALCTRPFTIFRWHKGAKSNLSSGLRFEKTRICLTCSRANNCCQCCMRDLTTGLSMSMRDAMFKLVGESAPGTINNEGKSTDIMKVYNAQAYEAKLNDDKGGDIDAEQQQHMDKIHSVARALIQNQGAKTPYQKPVSRGIKGKDENNSTENQPSKALMFSVTKLASSLPILTGQIWPPPEDNTLTSFLVMGIEDDLPEYKIKQKFISLTENDTPGSSRASTVQKIIVNHASKCCFIQFHTRPDAENVARIIASIGKNSTEKVNEGCLNIAGSRVVVRWSSIKSFGSTHDENKLLGKMVRKAIRKKYTTSTRSSNDRSLISKTSNRNKNGESGNGTVNSTVLEAAPGASAHARYKSTVHGYEA
ncbi:hypothetical protein NADFUDRAFT_50140 [Nadsonia fulvescens var. elongata DSM 6958]|uniref:Pre-mRNA-splicing factor SLT11 n=1 Tax=Nadsonia fulvescens var. elongata DSM 6958 TaxID=857566 RepID=A0A1E3PLA5_9ASCO|nr:hypothetical protein NADFUDRAFT_50140 [Nadsonia fulvescens var. elongata DSM 6958]